MITIIAECTKCKKVEEKKYSKWPIVDSKFKIRSRYITPNDCMLCDDCWEEYSELKHKLVEEQDLKLGKFNEDFLSGVEDAGRKT
jgi:hypothetical protein